MMYETVNRPHLITELKKRNLSTNGPKKDLINRLVQDDKARGSAASKSGSHYNLSLNGVHNHLHSGEMGGRELKEVKTRERSERQALSLHKSPVRCIYYFLWEFLYLLMELIGKIIRHKRRVLAILSLCLFIVAVNYIDGPHQPILTQTKKTGFWWLWWVGLGFLSSCGFGTGLHTFLLYLGPFIARVTLAAYECKSTDFPHPPYPDDIICPPEGSPEQDISMFSIVSKVQVEAILWGVGTAIGELPPYFMARAASLTGEDPDDEELEQFEELVEKDQGPGKGAGRAGGSRPVESASLLQRVSLLVANFIKRWGFIGILICASIPNPLFDLAGLTCGHFLVPFWSFFGATLIGKAVIKMHLQQFFVITIFSQHHVDTILWLIGKVPFYGHRLQEPINDYFNQQKEKLHRGLSERESWLQWASTLITYVMILYFLGSIVNGLARKYHKRLCKWRHDLNETLTTGSTSKSD